MIFRLIDKPFLESIRKTPAQWPTEDHQQTMDTRQEMMTLADNPRWVEVGKPIDHPQLWITANRNQLTNPTIKHQAIIDRLVEQVEVVLERPEATTRLFHVQMSQNPWNQLVHGGSWKVQIRP
jgi:hypothetical protein